MIKLTIDGRCVPYKRTTHRQKFVDKQYHKYRNYKQYVQTLAQTVYKSPPLEDYISIEVTVYLTGKTTPMGRDGDLDNYVKSICDSLNKVVFKDDRQVIEIKANKLPSDYERVEVIINKAELKE